MESLVGSPLEVDSRSIEKWARAALCLSRTSHVRGKETSGTRAEAAQPSSPGKRRKGKNGRYSKWTDSYGTESNLQCRSEHSLLYGVCYPSVHEWGVEDDCASWCLSCANVCQSGEKSGSLHSIRGITRYHTTWGCRFPLNLLSWNGV